MVTRLLNRPSLLPGEVHSPPGLSIKKFAGSSDFYKIINTFISLSDVSHVPIQVESGKSDLVNIVNRSLFQKPANSIRHWIVSEKEGL